MQGPDLSMIRRLLGVATVTTVLGCAPSRPPVAPSSQAAHSPAASAFVRGAGLRTPRAQAWRTDPRTAGHAAQPAPVMAALDSTSFAFELAIISPVDPLWCPQNVMVRDVTGDGLPDVVLSMFYAGTNGSQGWTRVRIHAGNPDGTLAAPVELDVRNAINAGHGLEVTDLDGDGQAEIVIANRSGLTIFRRAAGAWVSSAYRGVIEALYAVTVDADADGALDVFAQGWSDGADIYYGDGHGGIRSVAHVASPAAGYNTVRTADFTADGLSDVVVTNGQGWSRFWVHPFDRIRGLQSPMEFDLTSMQSRPMSGMAIGDINRDGRPDLVTSDEGSDIDPRAVRVFYRGAANDFASVVTLTPGTNRFDRPGAVEVADVDGNGYADIVVMLNSNDGMGYFLQDASGFAPFVRLRTDDNPWTNNFYWNKSIAVSDVNRDGCQDVVVAEASSSLRIFYGHGCTPKARFTSTPLAPLELRG
jgi:hypothetical protein